MSRQEQTVLQPSCDPCETFCPHQKLSCWHNIHTIILLNNLDMGFIRFKYIWSGVCYITACTTRHVKHVKSKYSCLLHEAILIHVIIKWHNWDGFNCYVPYSGALLNTHGHLQVCLVAIHCIQINFFKHIHSIVISSFIH